MIVRFLDRWLPFIWIPFLYVMMNPDYSRNDTDTFWHIELGRWMIAQRRVIKEAIGTYAGAHLPYVPHEAGFQLLAGGLYLLGGWQALHILTAACLGLLTWGLFRLVRVSREEMGMKDNHPILVLLVPLVVFYIYSIYFTLRPQILSTPLIVWFFVWMREFQRTPSWKQGAKLAFLSLLIANVHSGVWPVILVFYGMMWVESFWEKKLTRYHFGTLLILILAAVINPGGWHTISYFFLVKKSGFEHFIAEWSPIEFSSQWFFVVDLLIFILSARHSIGKNIFRFLLFIGLLYLGLSNTKQHLFLMLFLLYYVAVSIDHVGLLKSFKEKKWGDASYPLKWIFVVSLTINLAMGMMMPNQVPVKNLPVQELNYILNQTPHPKVMATYGMSGYVMFRHGLVLADGRFDPFIQDQTKGINGWNAFQRSIYGFESGELLQQVIHADHPDYVIVPKPRKAVSTTIDQVRLQQIMERLGKPDFVGAYGYVWKVS